jgi:hypothetical protein
LRYIFFPNPSKIKDEFNQTNPKIPAILSSPHFYRLKNPGEIFKADRVNVNKESFNVLPSLVFSAPQIKKEPPMVEYVTNAGYSEKIMKATIPMRTYNIPSFQEFPLIKVFS